MDLSQTIQRLYAQKSLLERVIASLEELVGARCGAAAADPAVPKKSSGRKSIGAVERQQVSERMKQYWARRQQVKSG